MSSTIHSRRSVYTVGALVTAALLTLALAGGFAPRAEAVPTAPQDCASPVCVFGVSKDACEGAFGGGVLEGVSCSRNGTDCRTWIVRDNIFRFDLRQSLDQCSDPGSPSFARCDETPELDGTVTVRGCFTLRAQLPCRLRGCWEGEFVLETEDGPVAFGTAGGTLGTGSHRPPVCLSNEPCGTDCEGCYEVQFIPGSLDPDAIGTWVVHLEGSLNGAVTSGTYSSSDLCISIQGTLRTPGTRFGGPTDVTAWEYCGTADGVLLAKCE